MNCQRPGIYQILQLVTSTNHYADFDLVRLFGFAPPGSSDECPSLDSAGLLRVVDFYLFMYRNRAVKGFVSPLIVQPSAKENEVSACQEKAPSDLVRKPLRSNLQILNLFEKVIQQNEIERDNVQVKNNPPTKRDASSPIREEKTSAVDSPQTAVKM